MVQHAASRLEVSLSPEAKFATAAEMCKVKWIKE